MIGPAELEMDSTHLLGRATLSISNFGFLYTAMDVFKARLHSRQQTLSASSIARKESPGAYLDPSRI